MNGYGKQDAILDLGKWWMPVRKWFYSSWLAYELTVQFYNYAFSTYAYFEGGQDGFSELLSIGSGVLMFVVCTFFLTIPACFSLFHFLNLIPKNAFELRLKRFL